MPPIPDMQTLWRDYTDRFNKKFEQPTFHEHPDDSRFKWFELNYNERVFKYSVQIIEGPKPEDGYPLYIGLHGGGEDELKENDGTWWGMMTGEYWTSVERYVKSTKKGGIYIAARGISDVTVNKEGKKELRDWYNLHWQPESYILLQRAIRGLFVPIPFEIKAYGLESKYEAPGYVNSTFVDPNRVFLLGFSAGGDGSFRFAANLPDVFAAINSGGGHPNSVPFYNIANLPLCIQCGEKDTTPKDPERVGSDISGVWRRARDLVGVSFGIDIIKKTELELLRALLPKHFQEIKSGDSTLDLLETYPFYPHECFIVKGAGHHDWSDTNTSDTKKYEILTNLEAWKKQQDDSSKSVPGAEDTVSEAIDPVPWVSEHKVNGNTEPQPRVRNPVPPFVVWDLATRPDRPHGDIRPWWENRKDSNDNRTIWSPKSFLYWLFIRKEDNVGLADRIHAAYHRESNSIWVDEARDYLGLLVNDSMLHLNEDINVYAGKDKLGTFKVTKSKRVAEMTLDLRGDPKLTFSAMIGFTKEGDKWSVESVPLLDWNPWTGDPQTNKRVNTN